MTCNTLSNPESLVAFEKEWSCFAKSIAGLTPFQMPEWLITWWRHFGSGTLHIITYRDSERLVGVIPFFLHEWNGRRQFTLIGSGVSDYLDPLVEPRASGIVIEQLGSYLSSFADWDICDLQDLSCSTPLKQLASNPTLAVEVVEDGITSAINLPEDFDSYWSERSSDLRRNVKRYRAKAEAEAPLKFVVADGVSEELTDIMIRLHGSRWRSVGQPGMVQVNHSAEFLKEIVAAFSSDGLTRFFYLRFNGKIAAAILGFLLNKQFFGYMTGFDPRLESFGFGRTILFETLRHLHASGIRRFDFLRGDEAYKSWWGAEPSPRCRLLITRRM